MDNKRFLEKLTLSLSEAFRLLNPKKDFTEEIGVLKLAEQVEYSRQMSAWDTVLQCIIVLNDG